MTRKARHESLVISLQSLVKKSILLSTSDWRLATTAGGCLC